MAWTKTILRKVDPQGVLSLCLGMSDGASCTEPRFMLDSLGNVVNPASAELQASLESRVKAGNAYISSVSKSPAIGSLNARITIQNPTGSGKMIYVYALEAAQDGAGFLWPSLFINPTTNLPSTVISTVFNQNSSSTNNSVAVVKADTALLAMSGGTLLGAVSLPAASRQIYDNHIYALAPGVTLGMNVTATVALNALVRSFFWEE